GGEFNTPVGRLIETATSESLVTTDWGLNMQICDEINRRADGPSHAVKALKRRLKSDNPKVLQLTLTLCETTIKNCSKPLHQALGSREFLAEVANLCNGQKGYEVRAQALSLVQDWGIAFQTDMSLAYAETYGRLKAQGARFPEVTGAAPVFTPAAASEARSTPQTMEKLEEDLQMVKDKITLCREMLPESAGVDMDPAFSEVVGFLEACRPRMVDLVEAGVSGALGEDTFAKCLQINDALLRTLDAEREGTPIAVEDGLPASGGAAPLLDLDGGSDDPLAGKMSSFSIGDTDDDFAELRKGKPSAAAGKSATGSVKKLGAVPLKTPAAATTAAAGENDDDLDDFLNSLTDDAGPAPASAGGRGGDLDAEDFDKMLS
ncbi:unnamed protein product, partial [Scytosiphon promiscuus]